MSLLFCAPAIFRRCASLRFPLKCKNCANTIKSESFSSATTRTIHDVNTNVLKDVILYKYENPKFYTYMNIFAVVQYMFWMYLGVFAFSSLKDAPVDRSKVDESTPWFRRINLGENKYRNTLGILAFVVGK